MQATKWHGKSTQLLLRRFSNCVHVASGQTLGLWYAHGPGFAIKAE